MIADPNKASWVMWAGSGPLPSHDTIVEVVALSGHVTRMACSEVDWRLMGQPSDVMLYRVISKKAAPATAPGILHKAAEIMEERGKQYDQPGGERSMGKAVAAFNIITGRNLEESEGWLLMQMLKDVRDRQKKKAHTDSLEDCVAYSALKAEARLAGR